MQAIYSDEHRKMTGNFGVKYETTSLQPVIAAAVAPWREPRQYRTLMAELPRTVGNGVLLRDRDGGSVTVDRMGGPVVRYALSNFDREHLRKGFAGAAQFWRPRGRGASIRRTRSSAFMSRDNEGRSRRLCGTWMRRDGAPGGWRCFHFTSWGRRGWEAPRRTRRRTREGETWEARNLLVMDGASFPSASGVNPMISIEAIAHRNAESLANRL